MVIKNKNVLCLENLTSLGISVFGLRFDFNTKSESIGLLVGGLGIWGGLRFSLKYFSLLILRLSIDYQLLINHGTIKMQI
jgi:hypothetical protein